MYLKKVFFGVLPTAAAVLDVGRLVQSPIPNTLAYVLCWRLYLLTSSQPAASSNEEPFSTAGGPIGGVTWIISYYDQDEGFPDTLNLPQTELNVFFLCVTNLTIATLKTSVSPGLSRFSKTASCWSALTSMRFCLRFTLRSRSFTISHKASEYFLTPNSTGKEVLKIMLALDLFPV